MILEKIIRQKRLEVNRSKELMPLEQLQERFPVNQPGNFQQALRQPGVSLIAEVKKASPSKGVLLQDFEPVGLAACYEANGAAAISVLTDANFFQGNLDYLQQVKQSVQLPVLRKDFLIDPYQVYEAKAYGADAVLLITAVLEKELLTLLLELARDLGLEALMEVHTRAELETALATGAEIIGINNRDLHTFQTDLQTTIELAAAVPGKCVLVSESGISSAGDVERLRQAGVDAVLVGEALVTSRDLTAKVRELAGVL